MLKINNIDVSTFGVSVLFESEETFTPEVRTNFIDGRVGSANASVSHGNAVHEFKCSIKGNIRENLEKVKQLFLDVDGEYKQQVKVEWDKWGDRYYNVLLNEAIILEPKSDTYGEFTLSLVSIDAFAIGTLTKGKYIESANLSNKQEEILVNYTGTSKTGFSVDFNGLAGELTVQTIDKDSNKKTFKYKENALTDTLNPSAISGVSFSQPWQSYVDVRANLNTQIINEGGQIYLNGADFDGKNLAKKTTATENRLLQNTGFLVNSATSFVTDFFKVEAGQILTFQKPSSATNSRIGYYDFNQSFMSMATWTANTFTMTVPEYVHYIRWCPDAASGKFNDGYMVSKGNTVYNIVPSVEDIAVDVIRRAADNILDIADKNKIIQYVSVFEKDFIATKNLAESLNLSTVNLVEAYNRWQNVVTTQSIASFLQVNFTDFTVKENGENSLEHATGDFLTINKDTSKIILSGNMSGNFNVSWKELYV